MPRTLFVSDVHLRPRDRAGYASFFEFLKEDCEALYILGDLFEYWMGPKHLKEDDYPDVLDALKARSQRSRVYFIHGNRDFLVEEKFASRTGVTVLGDRARISLGGRVSLLCHGDTIYNTNPKYSAYRALSRSKPVGDLWRAVPAAVGKRLLGGYRKVSRMTTPAASWPAEKIVERARAFLADGAEVLIAGHIHVPQHVSFQLNGRPRDIFILGDWEGGTQDYVDHDGRAFHFRRWPRR